jgi:hypothetical protein
MRACVISRCRRDRPFCHLVGCPEDQARLRTRQEVILKFPVALESPESGPHGGLRPVGCQASNSLPMNSAPSELDGPSPIYSCDGEAATGDSFGGLEGDELTIIRG